MLSATTGASALDGYLATTPGGLYAVLATASDIGADVTFVLVGPGAAAVRHAAERAAGRPLAAQIRRELTGTALPAYA